MEALIRLSIRHRGVVTVLAALLLLVGALRLPSLPLDVFPEFVPPQVVVQTEAPGLSPEQVEQLVTRPLEAALNGSVGLESIRSESILGLSVVNLTFRDDIDLTAMRQAVAERIATTAGQLPNGVHPPKLSPMTSSTMDLLKIGLVSDTADPFQLRELADWTLRPRLLAVPGVARLTVYGGEVRQVQVQPDPQRMTAAGIGLAELLAAARAATGARGGGVVDTPAQRIEVGVLDPGVDLAAIAATVVRNDGHSLLRIGDVASVQFGAAPKSGDALIQGRPGVLLAISGQYGANTLTATRAVEAAVAELAPQLAAQGVTVVAPIHRPATFIELALHNLGMALAIGTALILALLVLFLRDWRSALISFVTIPLSLLAAALVFERLGQTLNTLTLGGFAVALGVLVDDAIIDVENILRRLRENAARATPRPALEVVLSASVEIRAAVFYATVVVLLAFLPVLALSGVQGRLLAPMAMAFLLAVLASLIVALTVTPALAALAFRHADSGREPRWFERLATGHAGVLRAVDRRLGVAITVVLAALVAGITALPFLGGDFFPMFREGHFVLQVSSRLPGTSMGEMLAVGRSISADVLAHPYVAAISHQVGRAEQGEDTWGTQRSEFHVELAPGSGVDQRVVQEELRTLLARYPGLQVEVMTFLGDRLSETLTGETAQVVVNLTGPDLDALEPLAQQVAGLAAKLPGVTDLSTSIVAGTPTLDIRLDPAAMSLYGVRPDDALEAVATAFAGQTLGQVYDHDRAIDVVAILPAEQRARPDAVATLMLTGVDGTRVPLSAVARVAAGARRYSIQHEAGLRRVGVSFNVNGRSASAVVAELRAAIATSVHLPQRSFIGYAGVAEAEVTARHQLWLYSALTLGAIALALGVAFRRRAHALLVLANLPFALVGSIAAIALTGIGLSIGAMVGLVTVFGISARNAILLLAHFEQLEDEGIRWSDGRLQRGARERLRPVLMTALVTALGMLPLALGLGRPGHEIEAPMAITVLGGLASSTLLTLILLPLLARRWVAPPGTPLA